MRCFSLISLMMHYENTENDSFSELETDIVVYLVKIQNKINTKEKILQTVKLLKNYKAQIDAIGML